MRVDPPECLDCGEMGQWDGRLFVVLILGGWWPVPNDPRTSQLML